eukprot:TRINITY_DN74247_c0_g1_i1.p1 TRINITY_DN74247_c0_g1~~TRINITY_DN74247_c0_g1_i1.p1  ORF type:complete len:257 (-),score=32.86 TRINITY_DN74247_c0_g1_i1:85-855(-)
MNCFADQVEADICWRQLIGKERRASAAVRLPQSLRAALVGHDCVQEALRAHGSDRRPHSAPLRKSLGAGRGRRVTSTGAIATPELGDRVRVAGLRGRPALNGSSGRIVDPAPDVVGRVSVQLSAADGTSNSTGKVMRIAVEKLQPAASAHAAGGGARQSAGALGTSARADGRRPLARSASMPTSSAAASSSSASRSRPRPSTAPSAGSSRKPSVSRTPLDSRLLPAGQRGSGTNSNVYKAITTLTAYSLGDPAFSA